MDNDDLDAIIEHVKRALARGDIRAQSGIVYLEPGSTALAMYSSATHYMLYGPHGPHALGTPCVGVN